MPEETNGYPLPAVELALARARLYELIAELYSQGVTTANVELVSTIEELQEHLPAPFDADDAAATHYGLFEHQVAPFESVFNDSSALIGGPSTDRVLDSFRLIGFEPECDRPCDHVSQLFSALGFLSRQEHRQLARQQIADPRLVRAYQVMFFEHLLNWIHALSLVVIEQNDPFYTQVTLLVLELVESHSAEVFERIPSDSLPVCRPAAAIAEKNEGGNTVDTTSAGASVQGEKSLENRLIQSLVCPADCGFYVSRKLIGDLGRSLGVPRGFASRQAMLKNLFEASYKFDKSDELVSKLIGYCEKVGKYYADRMDARPHLKMCLSGRMDAVNRTRKALKQFEGESRAQ